jgi:hypothetical protein
MRMAKKEGYSLVLPISFVALIRGEIAAANSGSLAALAGSH